MQATLFWLTGGAFFALQIGMLLYLLYASPGTPGLAASEERRRRVEIVWTLVPASILVAVVLMVNGFTGSSWSRVRTADESGKGTIALHRMDARRAHSDGAR